MAHELGIFDSQSDGFVETGFWSKGEAESRIQELVTDGTYEAEEASEDLKVMEVCSEHNEQPQDTCEECATDGDEMESELDS
jgi:hypothetical protein